VQDEVRKELEAWIRERKVSYGLSHYLEYTFGGGGKGGYHMWLKSPVAERGVASFAAWRFGD